MDRESAPKPVNPSAAVGAVNEDPSISTTTVENETAEREQASVETDAPSESSAEHGTTESLSDQPSTETNSPDAIGGGPPD